MVTDASAGWAGPSCKRQATIGSATKKGERVPTSAGAARLTRALGQLGLPCARAYLFAFARGDYSCGVRNQLQYK